MKSKNWFIALVIMTIVSIGIFAFSSTSEETILDATPVLEKYWYQGLAEITSYSLDQNRYRDNHPGDVVLIQVTEDFLTDKQVKNDKYKNKNSIPVLKTNLVKKFKTGIYDYSLMSSIFTSVDKSYGLKTLKTTFSSQDWCGHSFLQSNLRNNKYHYVGHSYFEAEGDNSFSLDEVILEDEIINRIRMNPKNLPTGEFSIIPSSEYQRFNHKELKVMDANATFNKYRGNEFEGDDLIEYSIIFSENNRTISYYFEASSPYVVSGWKEESENMFTNKKVTTITKRKKTILIDYWTKNALNDRELRKKLDLDM